MQHLPGENEFHLKAPPKIHCLPATSKPRPFRHRARETPCASLRPRAPHAAPPGRERISFKSSSENPLPTCNFKAASVSPQSERNPLCVASTASTACSTSRERTNFI